MTPSVSPAGAGRVVQVDSKQIQDTDQSGVTRSGTIVYYVPEANEGYAFDGWTWRTHFYEYYNGHASSDETQDSSARSGYVNWPTNDRADFGTHAQYDWKITDRGPDASPADFYQENTVLELVAHFKSITGKVVAVAANPTDGGTVTGGGEYEAGDTCTVTATPASGWRFIRWSDGGTQTHSFVVSSNVTLTAYFERADILVTVIADPDEYGTVTGGGYYAAGETCTVTAAARTVSGKTIMFGSWSDGGSQTHSFVVTESVTLTAYFVECGNLYLGCYGRSMTWWRASPWRATMSYGGRSVTWDANTSDINGHMLSSALQVPIGESVSVTTSLTSAQVPAQMEYTFHGFFGWNPDDGTKPLLSANQTFQFTMTKATDWILPLFDAKIKCSVIPFRSLEYKDGTWQDHQRERLSGLSEIREPIVTLGTGETVTLVAKSNYWDFDITWDQVALEQIQSVAEGFESFFEMKVLIRPTKTAENDVTVGALQVVSSAFSIKTDGSSDRKFSVGVHDYSEYKDTGVPFSDAATFYSCKQVKSGVSTARAEINCDFALGPLIRWVVTASESLDVDRATITNDGWNFTNFYGSFTSENKTSGNYTSIKLAMIPAFKSGGRYSFRFPASATVLNGAVLRYFEGDDNSLSIRLVKNGTAQLPVKRGSGESVACRLTGYGSEYSFTSLGATDVLDVLMHVGTFWPLRNASGTILKGSSGSILNDS